MLINAGFLDETKAWCDWLLRADAGKPEQVQIMYGIAGERLLPESTPPWLTGFTGFTSMEAERFDLAWISTHRMEFG